MNRPRNLFGDYYYYIGPGIRFTVKSSIHPYLVWIEKYKRNGWSPELHFEKGDEKEIQEFLDKIKELNEGIENERKKKG